MDVPDPEGLAGISTVDLFVMAADAADLASQVERALTLVDTARDLVEETADPVRAGLIHARRAYFLWALGESRSSIDEYRIAIDSSRPSRRRPSAHRSSVAWRRGSGCQPVSRVQELAVEAIGLLRATGSNDGEARLLNVLGVDLVSLGEIDAGLEQLREAVTLAQEFAPIETRSRSGRTSATSCHRRTASRKV